jgi:hypothetical protein
MKRLLKFFFITISSLILLYGILWCTPFRRSLPGYHKLFYTSAAYKKECATIIADAKKMTRVQKDSLLLVAVYEKLFPYWSGTRWGFNGTTEIPGEGQIACGYFVTTVLRDCGIKLERERLAQLASEEMMKELLDEKNIQRYSKTDIKTFIAEVKKGGNQLYLLGLDNHVGFLVCEKGECFFIHSSGRYPWCVVKENAEESIAVQKSNYRVTGCLTTDDKFIARWEN